MFGRTIEGIEMLGWLIKGLASIGEGWSSIMGSFSGSPRFDDYQRFMPSKPAEGVKARADDESADARALRSDWKNLGKWGDLGNWNEIGKPAGKRRRRDYF